MSKRKSPAIPAEARKRALRAASGVKRPEPKAPEPEVGKGRKGRKGVVIYLHPLAKDVLARIAKERGKTVQDLGLEAFNLLFRSYREKPIC